MAFGIAGAEVSAAAGPARRTDTCIPGRRRKIRAEQHGKRGLWAVENDRWPR